MTASLDSDAATEALAGPQPLGAFDLPAGMLLVPTRTPEEDSVRRDLLAGRLPSSWPASLEAHRLAHQGDVVAAAAAFTGDDPTDRYNRWVLDADTATADEVRAGLPVHLHPLVDVVAWSVGASDDLPLDDPALPDEVRALVVATRASERMSTGRDVEARGLLQQAATLVTATNPVLAAVLLGNAAGLGLDHDADLSAARADLESALVDLSATDLRTMRAELLNQLGSLAHEEAARAGLPLSDAMARYYDALGLVTEESAPFLWASIQLNLATAHLATPMTTASDQLRLGVATQSLRACRRIFTPQDNPAQWSTATLNLANALVYTPSTHQADNLVEAVELYEEILESGVRDPRSVAYARVLANQGNALAHLGAPDAARAKLAEARFIFEANLDHDGALAVREVLDAISRSEVDDPDQAAFEADLARQVAQMSQVPGAEDIGRTSGMGVRVEPATPAATPPPDAQRRAKVTILRTGSNPADEETS